MQVLLMYRDREFDLLKNSTSKDKNIINDLDLEVILKAMSNKDEFIYKVCKKTLLEPLTTKEEILYRQEVLKDSLEYQDSIHKIYNIALECIEKKHNNLLGLFGKFPSSLLSSAISLIELYLDTLKELRDIANLASKEFNSEGFQNFFKMLIDEFDEEYIKEAKTLLKELRFKKGVLISSNFINSNDQKFYTLRRQNELSKNWIGKLFTKKSKEYSYELHPRDDLGAKIIRDIKDEALNDIAILLSSIAKDMENFFITLKNELGFYIGCINLHKHITDTGNQIIFPKITSTTKHTLSAKGLYNISLALTTKKEIVANDLDANNKKLIFITGANAGGKTTLLKSIGILYILSQCGMFVPASYCKISPCKKIFTHFKKEEDKSLTKGKFEEELLRMSTIIDQITQNSIVLFNESFTSTNEKEGFMVARQIIDALMEKNIKIFYVNHMFELSNYFYTRKDKSILFLRANKNANFKIQEAKPLKTSYAKEIYDDIFNPNYDKISKIIYGRGK